MKTIGQRIHERRIQLGMTADELAEKLNKNRATIYRYEGGEIENLPVPIISSLADALAVSPAYLMGWEENATTENVPLPPPDLLPVKRVMIPLLGDIAAGEPIRADEQYDTYIEADSDVHCDYALRVDGDSMEPTIRLGDLVFIRRQDDVDDGQIAAVLLDDSATLKHVYHIENGLTLTSDNAKYPPRTVAYPEYDTIRILGKAVAFKRML